MKHIYVAGPYRGVTKARRNLNILVCKHAGVLLSERDKAIIEGMDIYYTIGEVPYVGEKGGK